MKRCVARITAHLTGLRSGGTALIVIAVVALGGCASDDDELTTVHELAEEPGSCVAEERFNLRVGQHHTPAAINGEDRIESCLEQRFER